MKKSFFLFKYIILFVYYKTPLECFENIFSGEYIFKESKHLDHEVNISRESIVNVYHDNNQISAGNELGVLLISDSSRQQPYCLAIGTILLHINKTNNQEIE